MKLQDLFGISNFRLKKIKKKFFHHRSYTKQKRVFNPFVDNYENRTVASDILRECVRPRSLINEPDVNRNFEGRRKTQRPTGRALLLLYEGSSYAVF